MSFVLKRRQTTLPSFFRDRNNGEQVQFVSAQGGDAYVFENTAVVAEQTFRGITVSGVNQIDVRLPFQYFLGLKQISVYRIDPASGIVTPILRRLDYPAAGGGSGFFVGTVLAPAAQTFDELSSNDIRIYNTVPGNIFLAGFGHTAAPATLRDRLFISNDPENIAIEFDGSGDGIVFRAPNGQRYRLSVNNGGNVATDQV